jgi:integrase
MLKIISLYLSTHDLSADYSQALRRVAGSMAAAGIAPSNIDSSRFNAWLGSLPTGRTTRSNYCRMGKTLWAFAARKKLSPPLPDDILRIKPDVKPPVAWTSDELARLTETAARLTGRFRSSNCPQSLFWQAWVLIGYETGVRMSDLHNLRANQLRGRRLYVTHHKTGIPQGKILSENAVALARKLIELGDGKTIFRWALSRKHVFLHLKSLVKAAKLEGSTKFLRRSCATYCEIQQPGSASKALGHLSPHLALKYYCDPTLMVDHCPTPPPFLQKEGVAT